MMWDHAAVWVVIAASAACGQTSRDRDASDGVGGNTMLPLDASSSAGAGGGGGLPNAPNDAGDEVGSGGSAGSTSVACDYHDSSKWCPSDEYCGCDGFCHAAPKSCPTECDFVCSCASGALCNACIAKLKGFETNDNGLSGCTSDGGAPGYDGGVDAYCWNSNNCAVGLKCCYACDGPGSCTAGCAAPGPNGECLPLAFDP